MRVEGRSCLERGPAVTELVYWQLWHRSSRDQTHMAVGLLLNHLPQSSRFFLISLTVFRYIGHVNFIFINKFLTTSQASPLLSSFLS
jgi:hypothetical protein